MYIASRKHLTHINYCQTCSLHQNSFHNLAIVKCITGNVMNPCMKLSMGLLLVLEIVSVV